MGVLDDPRHERFAQALAAGNTAEAAYVVAGFKKNRFNAARFGRREHILIRVNELLAGREALHAQATAIAIENTALTKEWVIERLVENANRAMQASAVKDEDGNPIGEYRYDGSVANKALELLGKELGMFIDRKEIRTGPLDDLDAASLSRVREQLIAARAGRADRTVQPGHSGKPH